MTWRSMLWRLDSTLFPWWHGLQQSAPIIPSMHSLHMKYNIRGYHPCTKSGNRGPPRLHDRCSGCTAVKGAAMFSWTQLLAQTQDHIRSCRGCAAPPSYKYRQARRTMFISAKIINWTSASPRNGASVRHMAKNWNRSTTQDHDLITPNWVRSV